MQELSLNILDIAQNSIRANASLITIEIIRSVIDNKMTITIEDNGCGMSKEKV
ncbi:MAG: ATP-binding protein, partial [Massilimaliae sp.]|nr:ATP-binding protein [Massiliimalia sp.]